MVIRTSSAVGTALVALLIVAGALVPPRAESAPIQNLLVSNSSDGILEYNGTTGVFLRTLVPGGSGGLVNPAGLVIGPNGDLFVADNGTSSVLEYKRTTGAFVKAFVPPLSGGLSNPDGLVFGPNGNL